MSKLVLSGDTSGSVTLDAPAVSGTTILTLPTTTDTLVGKTTTDTLTNKTLTSPVIAGTPTGVGILTADTAKASTSGTSIDFTGIPSWVKRITVMFNGVSTSGTSNWLIQLGDSGGVENTGYVSGSTSTTTSSAISTSTAGFILRFSNASCAGNGSAIFNPLSGNVWVGQGTFYDASGTQGIVTLSGSKTLSDVLTQVRITTVNGTDTFDAGSINILYE
jgi:hypothetical protein